MSRNLENHSDATESGLGTIKILSRTDKPQITILNRTDRPQITILNRTDKPQIKVINRTDLTEEQQKVREILREFLES